MEKGTVLVTGIGGNVGQGIIRNIRTTAYDLKIIGTNISQMSPGNHLVDVFYQVPFSYEKNYISVISDIVKSEKIDLVIPSTDYEMFYLSQNKNAIPCKVADSGKRASEIYLDKYLTYEFHKANGIAFVESSLPSGYSGQYDHAIAKPRKGRGSRGLIKYVKSLEGLSDDEYLIQRMCDGIEITTAVYASYLTGGFHGLITMERSLENGATTYCKVVKDYDVQMEKIARDMIENSDLKGAFNIQSIVEPTGGIFPFEVNCRISGTNSIRSHFGFKDVAYIIDELLYQKAPPSVSITSGVAYRYLADVIYPNGVTFGNISDNFITF